MNGKNCGLWPRSCTKFLSIIYNAIVFALCNLIAFKLLAILKVDPQYTLAIVGLIAVLYFLASAFYYVKCITSNRQVHSQKMLNIYVKSSDDSAITKRNALTRYLLTYFPIFLLLFSIGLAAYLTKISNPAQPQEIQESVPNQIVGILGLVIFAYYLVMAGMIMFRKDKRGFHDIICHTQVIRSNSV